MAKKGKLALNKGSKRRQTKGSIPAASSKYLAKDEIRAKGSAPAAKAPGVKR
jgi:hypothetical protein